MLVVPDVGAGAEARAGVVEAAFKAVEAALGAAEGGLGPQRAEIEKGGFLDRVGDVGGAKRAHELDGVALEVRQTGGGVLGGVSRRRDAGGVVIADPVGAIVAAAHDVPGEAVGKVPGEQEGDGALGAWLQVHGGGQRCRGGIGGAGRAVVERAVGAEVVPEIEQRIAPGDVVPGGAGGDGLVGGVEDGEGQGAPLLGIGGNAF